MKKLWEKEEAYIKKIEAEARKARNEKEKEALKNTVDKLIDQDKRGALGDEVEQIMD